MNVLAFNVDPPQTVRLSVPNGRLTDLVGLLREQLKVAHEKTDVKLISICYIETEQKVVSCRTSGLSNLKVDSI